MAIVKLSPAIHDDDDEPMRPITEPEQLSDSDLELALEAAAHACDEGGGYWEEGDWDVDDTGGGIPRFVPAPGEKFKFIPDTRTPADKRAAAKHLVSLTQEFARRRNIKLKARAAAPRNNHHKAQKKQRGAAARSSAASGDGNADPADPDPERRPSLHLLDQAALAALLRISKKTLQNQYSVAPHTLPAAIQIPRARGPRWTPQAIQEWLEQRPPHTPKPVPQPSKRRKVGRPRIAVVNKEGGAS